MTWEELIKDTDTKRKFLKELLSLATQQYFAKERVESFIDGLKREQIEKLFENIEDGTKALKEHLESKNNKSKEVSD